MHALMSCVKNEGPFVLEFVAHHLVLGFDRILIASNDCIDGTDILLDALHDAGFVHHLKHHVPANMTAQYEGYAKLRGHFGLKDVEWVMVLDADEFLHVSKGSGTVQCLTSAAPPQVDVIALNARTFGTILGGTWQPGRVCAQFTYRLGQRDKRNGMVKSLTRAPTRFRRIENHFPVGLMPKRALCVMRADGNIFDIPMDIPLWHRLRVMQPKEIRHDWAHFNHYSVKTYDSFALRRARGRGARPNLPETPLRHSDDYFAEHMLAATKDEGIAIYAARVVAKMNGMLGHHAIAKAQTLCEQRYGAMIDDIRHQLGL